MDSTTSEDDQIGSISYHVVAFIDILGQKEWLQKMAFVPQSEADWERLKPILQNTKGAVDAFRYGFESLLEEFKKYNLPPRQFVDLKQKQLYDAIGNCDLRLHTFSDFVIVHSSVGETKTNYPIIDVWHMLLMCSHMFISMLRIGKPIRGGLALGPAFDGELYGNPYCVAYDQESLSAKWPRIVVHESFAKFIWCQDGMDETDPRRPMVLVFQNMCKNLLTRDVDGQLIVDYMGNAYKETLALQPSGLIGFTKHLHLSYEFAIAEQKRFREEGNTKLAWNYHMLCSYMAAHIKDWPKL